MIETRTMPFDDTIGFEWECFRTLATEVTYRLWTNRIGHWNVTLYAYRETMVLHCNVATKRDALKQAKMLTPYLRLYAQERYEQLNPRPK